MGDSWCPFRILPSEGSVWGSGWIYDIPTVHGSQEEYPDPLRRCLASSLNCVSASLQFCRTHLKFVHGEWLKDSIQESPTLMRMDDIECDANKSDHTS